MDNKYTLKGRTKIYVNDVLVEDKTNTILVDLKSYLASCLNSAGGSHVGSGSLFSNAQSGSTPPLAGDGIAVAPPTGPGATSTIDFSDGLAMETTDITGQITNEYAARWKGTMTANSAITLARALIGSDWDTQDFTTNFASQSFQSVTLAQDDTLTIEWEIAVV